MARGPKIQDKTLAAKQRMIARIARGVGKAAAVLERDLKEAMSLPGPKTRKQKRRQTKQQAARVLAAGVTERASFPGEPLRRRTGMARSSVMSARLDALGLVRRIGYSSAVPYAAMWELAEERVRRPGLRLSFNRRRREMNAIIGESLRSASGG